VGEGMGMEVVTKVWKWPLFSDLPRSVVGLTASEKGAPKHESYRKHKNMKNGKCRQIWFCKNFGKRKKSAHRIF
jgi:hypothetical protein